MDWISVSIVYSHLTYYELRMIHDRKSSRSVSSFARADCSLRKGAFHSIRESEICFVLRIIKRNYKLKFSGLTVEKVSIPLIEPVSFLKQSIFRNVGRISDFVVWNVQRDAGILVQESSFFSKTAFTHKVCLYTWNLGIILMYRDINLLKSFMVKTWDVAERITCCIVTLDGPNYARFCKT